VIDALISERTVSVVILINALALFLQDHAHDHMAFEDPWFLVDYICVSFYLLEAILKIGRLGWRGYWSNGWNRFDMFVLLLSLPVLGTPWLDLRHFSVAAILRMGRLLRLFRLMHFIPNRHHLVDGIRRALKASVGVFLALAVVNIILAVGASMLFGELAPEHFDTPAMASYSIFRVFTVEGWHEIPALLADRAQDPSMAILARIYFVFCVTIGGLLGLSLANAVFVDEMTMDNTIRLEGKVDALQEDLREIRKMLGRGEEPGGDA